MITLKTISMKKMIYLFIVASMVSVSIISGCSQKEDEKIPEEVIQKTAKTKNTTFKYAANGKDCGLTDGYADQQHKIPELVHLNTDKCNGETFRPTITLNFSEVPAPGIYNVVDGKPTGKQVKIESLQYNFTDWNGTAGSVEVTKNADDATKVDIELKSIKMTNKKGATDPKNPATDVLTGFIIKI